jgi:cell division protein FtsW
VGFFSRLKTIAERCSDDFSRLLVIGVLAWLSVQALINVGGIVGLIPLKGITLPFVSYGGTSVVFVAAAVGLVFQVSRYTALSAPRTAELSKRPSRNLQAFHRADL